MSALKKLSVLVAATFALMAIMTIPASGATGGLASTYYRPAKCKRHAKKHRCHRHRRTEPAKPLESPEPFAAEGMEVFQVVDTLSKKPPSPTPAIYGLAKAYFPVKDEITIRFLAEYGSFINTTGGFANKFEPSPYYSARYMPPTEGGIMPADGYDEAWMVVMDRSKNPHVYVETEHVRFNIKEPENVRHPVG